MLIIKFIENKITNDSRCSFCVMVCPFCGDLVSSLRSALRNDIDDDDDVVDHQESESNWKRGAPFDGRVGDGRVTLYSGLRGEGGED